MYTNLPESSEYSLFVFHEKITNYLDFLFAVDTLWKWKKHSDALKVLKHLLVYDMSTWFQS